MILKTLSLFPMAQPQDCFEHRYLRDTGAAFGNRLRPSSSSCCRSSWRGLYAWRGKYEINGTVSLIQQPEHPQRDAVAVADFGVIDG